MTRLATIGWITLIILISMTAGLLVWAEDKSIGDAIQTGSALAATSFAALAAWTAAVTVKRAGTLNRLLTLELHRKRIEEIGRERGEQDAILTKPEAHSAARLTEARERMAALDNEREALEEEIDAIRSGIAERNT